ncbi:MAG: DUF222 domain-containing protein [Gulosibacter sp.]|uniref:DUF222 domain-containing protein n=1 Tax=Gulosibacter sp. TaxID=2817531 RepID=UPI003F90571D
MTVSDFNTAPAIDSDDVVGDRARLVASFDALNAVWLGLGVLPGEAFENATRAVPTGDDSGFDSVESVTSSPASASFASQSPAGTSTASTLPEGPTSAARPPSAPVLDGQLLENQLEALSESLLLEFVDSLARHYRQLGAVLAITTRELRDRSRASLGEERLAFRHGYRSAEQFVAERLGTDTRVSNTLARVGTAIVGERGLTGDRVPARTEHVASALRSGELGLAYANEIVTSTNRLATRPHLDPVELRHGERELVNTAVMGMPLRDFEQVVARLEAHLDPDGVAPSIEAQRRKRGLSFRTDTSSGMVYVRGQFDGESGAYITHALQSYATGVLRSSRGLNLPEDPDRPATQPTTDVLAAAAEAGSETVTAATAGATGTAMGASPSATELAQVASPESVTSPTSSVSFRPVEPALRDAVDAERRTISQIHADALVDFAKHVIGCDHEKLPGPSTTLVVRIDQHDLVPPASSAHDTESDTDARGTTDPTPSNNVGPAAEPKPRTEPKLKSKPGPELKSKPGPELKSVTDPDPEPKLESASEPGSTPSLAGPARTGLASIDGNTLIDIATARKLAAAANIIPAVLGTDGAVLDLGRDARHFSRAQRLALVERDGGCAFCGLPPSMTEAHHIRWWKAHDGTTNLDNGILLCTTCHHRVHAGWDIRIVHQSPESPISIDRRRQPLPHALPHESGISGSERAGTNQRAGASGRAGTGTRHPNRGGTVWFIPPATVDPRQEPRLGGRKRFDIAYRKANPPIPIPEHTNTSWTSPTDKLAG